MPLGPTNLCRVSSRHSAKTAFAECRSLPSARHSAKASLPSAIFCRVRRSAKQVFAECPKFGTRQRFLHSANHVFPVVLDAELVHDDLEPVRLVVFGL